MSFSEQSDPYLRTVVVEGGRTRTVREVVAIGLSGGRNSDGAGRGRRGRVHLVGSVTDRSQSCVPGGVGGRVTVVGKDDGGTDTNPDLYRKSTCAWVDVWALEGVSTIDPETGTRGISECV